MDRPTSAADQRNAAQPISARDALCAELDRQLWRQRSLLTEMAYRLEVQRLVLLHGDERWVGLATEEADRTLTRLQRAEAAYRHLVEELSQHLPVPSDASLGQLRAAVPPAWGPVIDAHHAAISVLMVELSQAADDARFVLQKGLAETRRYLADLRSVVDHRIATADDHYGVDRPGGLRGPTVPLLVDREV